MGLGYQSAMWHRTRPALVASYRTIALDNRGSGLSDTPPGPYSIRLMTSDAAAVLDAARIQNAPAFAVSSGGMIAQVVSLQNSPQVLSPNLGSPAPCRPPALR